MDQQEHTHTQTHNVCAKMSMKNWLGKEEDLEN
jgi:hypothetical protein